MAADIIPIAPHLETHHPGRSVECRRCWHFQFGAFRGPAQMYCRVTGEAITTPVIPRWCDRYRPCPWNLWDPGK